MKSLIHMNVINKTTWEFKMAATCLKCDACWPRNGQVNTAVLFHPDVRGDWHSMIYTRAHTHTPENTDFQHMLVTWHKIMTTIILDKHNDPPTPVNPPPLVLLSLITPPDIYIQQTSSVLFWIVYSTMIDFFSVLIRPFFFRIIHMECFREHRKSTPLVNSIYELCLPNSHHLNNGFDKTKTSNPPS